MEIRLTQNAAAVLSIKIHQKRQHRLKRSSAVNKTLRQRGSSSPTLFFKTSLVLMGFLLRFLALCPFASYSCIIPPTYILFPCPVFCIMCKDWNSRLLHHPNSTMMTAWVNIKRMPKSFEYLNLSPVWQLVFPVRETITWTFSPFVWMLLHHLLVQDKGQFVDLPLIFMSQTGSQKTINKTFHLQFFKSSQWLPSASLNKL